MLGIGNVEFNLIQNAFTFALLLFLSTITLKKTCTTW